MAEHSSIRIPVAIAAKARELHPDKSLPGAVVACVGEADRGRAAAGVPERIAELERRVEGVSGPADWAAARIADLREEIRDRNKLIARLTEQPTGPEAAARIAELERRLASVEASCDRLAETRGDEGALRIPAATGPQEPPAAPDVPGHGEGADRGVGGLSA